MGCYPFPILRLWLIVFYLHPLDTLSPLTNPHKSGIQVPPLVLSLLESCQMVLYKIDEITSETFKEFMTVQQTSIGCGQMYIDSLLLLTSTRFSRSFPQQSDILTPECCLRCKYFPTGVLHFYVPGILFYFYSLMISHFHALDSQSVLPLSIIAQASRNLGQVQSCGFLQSRLSQPAT